MQDPPSDSLPDIDGRGTHSPLPSVMMPDWLQSSEVILIRSCYRIYHVLTLASVAQEQVQTLRKIQDQIGSDPASVHTAASIDGYHPRAQLSKLLAEDDHVCLFLFAL